MATKIGHWNAQLPSIQARSQRCLAVALRIPTLDIWIEEPLMNLLASRLEQRMEGTSFADR